MQNVNKYSSFDSFRRTNDPKVLNYSFPHLGVVVDHPHYSTTRLLDHDIYVSTRVLSLFSTLTRNFLELHKRKVVFHLDIFLLVDEFADTPIFDDCDGV